MTDPEWIFFDCFDTLVEIDGFSRDGDYTVFMSDTPVQLGFFASAGEFSESYRQWRERRLGTDPVNEVILHERLRQLFIPRAEEAAAPLDDAIEATVGEFYQKYSTRAAPTPIRVLLCLLVASSRLLRMNSVCKAVGWGSFPALPASQASASLRSAPRSRAPWSWSLRSQSRARFWKRV